MSRPVLMLAFTAVALLTLGRAPGATMLRRPPDLKTAVTVSIDIAAD